MNKLILVLLIGASVAVKADIKPVKKTISPKQMLTQVKDYIGHLNSDSKDPFMGELDEIGGECFVNLEKDEKGRDIVVLKSDKGFQIDTVVFADDKIKFTAYESDDGSFSHVFEYGIGGVNKLTFTHQDDASDAFTLRTGSTSLSCGVYY